jgi:DNA polymerase
MHLITLGSETDFDGWRKAARLLALHNVDPSDVTWTVQDHTSELLEASSPPFETSEGTFRVPAKFVELAKRSCIATPGALRSSIACSGD